MDALGNYLGMALYRGQQNPALSYFEGMKAAEVPVEMQLRGAQAQKAISELEQERQLRTAMQGIDLSTPEGMNQAIAAAGKISPMMAMKFATVRDAMQADARKALSETINNASKFMKDNLPGLQLNQYPMFKQTLTAMNPLVGFNTPPLEAFSGPDREAKFAEWKNKTLYGSTMLQQSMKPPRMEKFRTAEGEATEWVDPTGKVIRREFAPKTAEEKGWTIQTRTNPDGSQDIIRINKNTGEVIPVTGKMEGMDEDTRKFFARMLLTNPKSLPGLGLGPQVRMPLFKEAAKIALEEDINPTDTAIKQGVLSTIQQGLGRLEGTSQQLTSFVRTFDRNISALREQSGKVGRTGTPLINRYLMWTKGEIAGDPEVSKFNVYLGSVAREAARITSTATGGGGVTAESEINKWENMIKSSQTPAQLNAALDAMETESKNRMASIQDQIRNSRSRMKEIAAAPAVDTFAEPGIGAPTKTPSIPDSGLPPGSTLVPGYTPNGKPVYKTPDGKYLEKQ